MMDRNGISWWGGKGGSESRRPRRRTGRAQGISGRVRTWLPRSPKPPACWEGSCHLHICPRKRQQSLRSKSCSVIFKVPSWTLAHLMSSSSGHVTDNLSMNQRFPGTWALVAGAKSELSLPSACQSQASIWLQLLQRDRLCLSAELQSLSSPQPGERRWRE